MSETNGERSTWEPASTRAITRDRYDAVLLDLDGVITDIASIHAAGSLEERKFLGENFNKFAPICLLSCPPRHLSNALTLP